MFCQFVSGYLGRSPDQRGRGIAGQPLWSMLELQELLDVVSAVDVFGCHDVAIA